MRMSLQKISCSASNACIEANVYNCTVTDHKQAFSLHSLENLASKAWSIVSDECIARTSDRDDKRKLLLRTSQENAKVDFLLFYSQQKA